MRERLGSFDGLEETKVMDKVHVPYHHLLFWISDRQCELISQLCSWVSKGSNVERFCFYFYSFLFR